MDTKLFSGAVLAGGRSLRMGEDKAKLNIGGRTFLQVQAEKLIAAGIQDIIVSLGAPQEAGENAAGLTLPDIPGTRIRTVADSAPGLGPLEGIRAVLEVSENELCEILSVDAVLVKAQTLNNLMKLAAESGSAITLLASKRGPEPLIGVYSKEILPEVSKCLSQGQRAVRAVFKAFPPALLTVPEGDPQLLNCNTPEDYLDLSKIYKESHL